MSTSISFGDNDEEWAAPGNLAEFFVDAGQIFFPDAEGGESPIQAPLEDSLNHTQERDRLALTIPSEKTLAVQAMISSEIITPDQRLLWPHILPQPVIAGQTVNHLEYQGNHHSQMKLCSVGKRRVRGPDWSGEEKRAYLQLKMEALSSVKGKVWDFISHNLEKQHGFRRSAKCCEDLWGTLRKAFKLIRGHENNKTDYQVSYWKMDADDRARNKLPKSFPEDWFTMMDTILDAQEQRSGKKSKVGYTKTKSVDDQYQIHPGKRLEDLQVKQHVSSALQRLGDNLGPSGLSNSATSTQKDWCCSSSPGEEENALLTLVSQRVEDAVTSALEPVIVASVGPQLVKKWLIDVLHSSLVRPVASTLHAARTQEEVGLEARLKAIEKTRRALDHEEMQIKRQRIPSKGLGKKIPVTSVAEKIVTLE